MNHPLSLVYNIDCMEYMQSLPDNHFDIAIVDPPYGLDKKSTHGRGKLKDRCLNRGNIQKWDIRPTEEYFNELFRVSKNQIIWGWKLLSFASYPLFCMLGQTTSLGKLLSM